jgi:adenosylcobinamide-GDP ribazoletransferase
VGVLLGGLLALASVSLSRFGAANGPAAWVLVALCAVLTGGLPLDGLADTFDGLLLHGGPERRLSAMRDPRVGSHGVTAVVIVLLGKVMALQSMGDRRRALALFGAIAASRTLLLVSAGSACYARPDGTVRAVIDAASSRDALAGSVLVPILGAATCGVRGLLAGLIAVTVASALTRLASRRLGGITGDTLGAVVELGELAFLMTLGLDGPTS